MKYDPFTTAFIDKQSIEIEEEDNYDYYEDNYSDEDELEDSSWRIRCTSIIFIQESLLNKISCINDIDFNVLLSRLEEKSEKVKA